MQKVDNLFDLIISFEFVFDVLCLSEADKAGNAPHGKCIVSLPVLCIDIATVCWNVYAAVSNRGKSIWLVFSEMLV